MTNRNIFEKISILRKYFTHPLRQVFQKQKPSSSVRTQNQTPLLSLDAQLARIEDFLKISHAQSLDLCHKHQTGKELLNSLTYTLEKLTEDLDPLLLNSRKKTAGYRKVKIQAQRSPSDQSQPKVTKAA